MLFLCGDRAFLKTELKNDEWKNWKLKIWTIENWKSKIENWKLKTTYSVD